MSQSYDLKKAIVRGLHEKLSNNDIIDIHEDIVDALEWKDEAITESEIELLKNELNIQERVYKKIKGIVSESILEKSTNTKKSWEDMMEDLSSAIDKPIILDDAGNYNVCDCEPFHISIRPIVHDIFDVVSYKDGTDRTKILYIKFKELKEFVKNYLSDNSPNYVDCAYDKVCDNSKDKEGGKASNDIEKDISVNSEGSPITNEKAKNMNKEEDNPDEPMRDVGDFKKMKDYPETKPKYTIPKLDKNLKDLVVKYGKRSKGRPRK